MVRCNVLALAAGLLSHGVTAGTAPPIVFAQDSGGGAQQLLQGEGAEPVQEHQTLQAGRKLHGKFLHITDLHPDPYYKVHSSLDQRSKCHRGKGPAGSYGAETSDCDSPYSLINETFAWIDANLKDDIDFVVWTGDSARHDSDERVPRTASQVLDSNRWVADKFAEVFAEPRHPNPGRYGSMAVPIVPTFGNNDILPHNILLPGPNKWLNAYLDIWRAFIPEEQRHGFSFGGWFYVEVVPRHLAVFSLNTLYFFDRNAGVDGCAKPAEIGFKQMEWLRVQLEFMRSRGMKAILIGHVPPARTESKQSWDETCWQRYTLWLHQFRDVIVGGLYGHMNVDHFFLHDAKEIDIAKVDDFDAEDGSGVMRQSLDDEFSTQSTADYLQELRDRWAKLPKPVFAINREEEQKNREHGEDGRDEPWWAPFMKKHKRDKALEKIGGPFAERYQLTMVGPSVVPNYFPTLRVFEYNITGLEDNPTWAQSLWDGEPPLAADQMGDDFLDVDINEDLDEEVDDEDDEKEPRLELRSDSAEAEKKAKKRKKHKGKKDGKHKKPKKDPNLIVPNPPSSTSPPGPAYSPQPLTLTGYTQYFANLTYLNNDITKEDDGDVAGQGWHEGKHADKKPKSKKPKPHPFAFDVEYSTFKDKIFNLTDLTVYSYVELAYRMGQKHGKSDKGKSVAAKSTDAQPTALLFALMDTLCDIVPNAICRNGDRTDVDDDDDGGAEYASLRSNWDISDADISDATSYDFYEEAEAEDIDVEAVSTSSGDDDDDDDDDTSAAKKNGKNGKKHKKKKRHHNRVWLHFLRHAFVSTVDEDELKKL